MDGTKNKDMIKFIAEALMLLQQRLREVFPTASIILYQPIPPLNANVRAYECLYGALQVLVISTVCVWLSPDKPLDTLCLKKLLFFIFFLPSIIFTQI